MSQTERGKALAAEERTEESRSFVRRVKAATRQVQVQTIDRRRSYNRNPQGDQIRLFKMTILSASDLSHFC